MICYHKLGKLFATSKKFLVLTCLNINLELNITSNQAKYVSRGTCLECLPPQGKFSAS